MRSIPVILVFILSLPAARASAQLPPAQATGQETEATFVALQNGRQAAVRMAGEHVDHILGIRTLATFHLLENAGKGDRLALAVDDAANPTTIQAVMSLQKNRGFWPVVGYIAAALAILLAFGAVVTQGNPLALVIGGDNRYSNSKLQMAAWFFVLISIYVAAVLVFLVNGWSDYIGQISIPQNLVILSGLSTLTYGAAKVITVTKVADAKAISPQYLAATGAPPPAAATPLAQVAADAVYQLKVTGAARPRWRDLVQDDEGCVDLADCQALFITLLALVLYVISGYVFLSRLAPIPGLVLPDVDSTLLSIFGLGQGAYLAKKVASVAGKG
jgi:hypothetical protein